MASSHMLKNRVQFHQSTTEKPARQLRVPASLLRILPNIHNSIIRWSNCQSHVPLFSRISQCHGTAPFNISLLATARPFSYSANQRIHGHGSCEACKAGSRMTRTSFLLFLCGHVVKRSRGHDLFSAELPDDRCSGRISSSNS